MAKTTNQIWMDFKNASNQANRLEEIAGKIESTSRKDLTGNLNQLSSCWKSDSSTAFRKKGQNTSDNLLTVAKNLREAATVIRTVAKNTYDAEMEAVRLANVRSYKS